MHGIMLIRSAVLAAILAVTAALQKPERHFGCPVGKNVCVYPIDSANIQCESMLDFQVALHIPANQTIQNNWRQEIDIKLFVPSAEVLTPENVFGKQAELRSWRFGALEDIADRDPDMFMSYAVIYRNVFFPQKFGKGVVKVEVRAQGVLTTVQYILREPTKRRAKNVILFVGDGMALPMMAAARLVSRGMVDGKFKDLLNMEKMPYFGLQNPSGVDSIIPDSANSATALMSGHKTSVDSLGVYADSSDDADGQPKVETIAEYVKRKFNMSVGVISTAEVQDATPAAVWAHIKSRSEKDTITSQIINGCATCTTALLPEVLMGGGGRYFLPNDSVDGSNMYVNYSNAGYTVTYTKTEMMEAANNLETQKLLTISQYGDMNVWLDRNVYTDNLNVSENSPRGDGVAPTDQPSLDDMVTSALKILSRNENGFFLLVEAASIDKAAHQLDVPRMLSDLIELDNVVGNTVQWAKEHGDDTLIIATADHAQGFDVFGTVDTKIWDLSVISSDQDPVRDVENLCKPVTDNVGRLFRRYTEVTTNSPVREANQARRLAIGIIPLAGFPDYKDSDGDGFPDTWDVRTVLAAGMNNFPDHTDDYRVSSSMKNPALLTSAGYLDNPADDPNGIFFSGNMPSYVPFAVHTLQDVGIFATGPGAERVGGFVDSTEVYHYIASALGFGTDGQIDTNQYLFGQLVKCINDNTKCHCATANARTQCACKQFGPEVFVRPSMKLCSKINGTPVM